MTGAAQTSGGRDRAFHALFWATLLTAILPTLITQSTPFVDLEGFTHLNGYPAARSFGPYHYYVFQFTYLVHHVFYRALTLLGFGTGFKSHFFLFAQSLAFLTCAAALLQKFARDKLTRCLGICLLALGNYDGMFLWGGPLAFSLMITSLFCLVTWLAYQAEAPRVRMGYPFIAAPLLAMAMHPFALVFFGMLYAVLILRDRRPSVRLGSLLGLACLALYAYLTVKESPLTDRVVPTSAVRAVGVFFHFNGLSDIARRLRDIFAFDPRAVAYLFGARLGFLSAYLYVLAALRLLGYLASIPGFFRKREPLAFLYGFNAATFLYYLLACGEGPLAISEWPHRVMMASRGTSLVCSLLALEGWLPARLARPIRQSVIPLGLGVLVVLASIHLIIMQYGRRLDEAYAEIRRTIPNSAADGFVSLSGWENIRPFYLRALPFMFFDDPTFIARGLLFETEWHGHSQHNSKLNLPLLALGGLRHFSLAFQAQAEPWQVRARFSEPLPLEEEIRQAGLPNIIRLRVRFAEVPPAGYEPLVSVGEKGSGTLIKVRQTGPGQVQFMLDCWGNPTGAASVPLAIKPGSVHQLDIVLGSLNRVGAPVFANQGFIFMDGRMVLRAARSFVPAKLGDIIFGVNAIRAQDSALLFSGKILSTRILHEDLLQKATPAFKTAVKT